jgi:plasmid maintenance system antidote protein VapI
MAVSDDLMRLSERAKQAEDRAAAAKTQARDKLEQDVQTARQTTPATADKLRDAAGTKADGLQQSWSAHVTRARERIDARMARHDAKVAERNADDADDYAAFAIDFAYSAIEEAEYAVLDSVLARLDADEAADAATS